VWDEIKIYLLAVAPSRSELLKRLISALAIVAILVTLKGTVPLSH